MATVSKTDGTQTIFGADHKVVGNIAAAKSAASSVAPLVAPQNEIMTTGKTGSDVPPLVVEFIGPRGGSSRFYIKDPSRRQEALDMGATAALDAGIVFPSITSCIGSLDKPALVPWAAGLTADVAEEYLRELQNMDPVSMAEAIDDLLTVRPGDKSGRTNFNAELRSAHRDRKNTAATRGTLVHSICEQLEHGTMNVEDVPEEFLGYVEAYQKFRDEYPDMKFIATEITMAGGSDGSTSYMGTIDAIVEYRGKTYVLDLKTNDKSAVYSSVGMQLSAAANSSEIVFADGRTQPMFDISGGIAIGLNGEGKYQVFLFETEAGGVNHQGFLASIEAWKWKNAAPANPKALKSGQALKF